MSALGSLVVKLALNYAEYTKGLDKSDQAALAFAKNAQKNFDDAAQKANDFFVGTAAKAGVLIGSVVGVSAAIAGMNQAIDDMAALDDLSQKTGAAVENLSRMQKVAKEFNSDFGLVDGSLQRLAKGMASVDDESNKTNKALRALGVSSKDSAGKLRDPSAVLVDVAKRLQDYRDGAGKTALINDLLGKSGADMLPYLNDLAENYDRVTGISAEAAKRAADLQDKMGGMRTKVDELYSSLATAAVPALTDLAGALDDSLKSSDGLVKSEVGNWADDLAVGVARVVDVARLLPKIFNSVAGSFKVVWADIQFAMEFKDKANPISVIKSLWNGKNPNDELKQALAERNKVLAEANANYDSLWNDPANSMEQAILKRIAARTSGAASAPAAAPEKQDLNYVTGNTKGASTKESDYDRLNKSLQERLSLSAKEVETGRALTASETELTKLMNARAEGTIKLSDKEEERLVGLLKQIGANEQVLRARADFEKADKASVEAAAREMQSIEEQTRSLEEKIKTYGMLPEAITAAKIAELEAEKQSLVLTEAGVAEIQRKIDALTALKDAQTRFGAVDRGNDVTQAKEYLDIMTEVDNVTRSAAAGMAESFGKVGSAIGGLTTAMSGFAKSEASIAAKRAAAVKAAYGDQEKIQKINAVSARESAEAQVRSYGDMASAAKGFFNESSNGYRIMEGVEKAFRAAEMAMAIESMVTKSGLLTQFTSLFVASKAAETAATEATVAPEIAASMAKGSVAAAVGVATQAQGDPYTAWPRMAAMAALMAALGFAVAGGRKGGGGVSAADRQKTQGSGTVFGDAQAKSDSINASIERLEEHSSDLLPLNRDMLSALRSIEASMSGLANLVVRTPGMIDASNMGIQEGTLRRGFGGAMGSDLGWVISPALKLLENVWGKTTQKIIDSGLQFSGSVRDLQEGNGFSQYASVDTTKSSWFGLKKKTSNSVQTQGLGPELGAQFAKIFSSIEDSLETAAQSIGIGGDQVTKALDGLKIDESISLKGLSGDALNQAINAVISKTMDQMAQAALPAFDEFRAVGEGYAETVIRVTSNYTRLDAALNSIGTTFRATGVASLAGREDLIALVGGIDELADKTASFAENFLTEAERLAPVQTYVTQQLVAMGLAHLDSREAFKQHLLALDPTIKAEREQMAALLDLEKAFAATHAASVDLSKSEQEIADERRSLQDQLDQLRMTDVELRNKERAALDASNRALYDQIVAAERSQVVAEERRTLQDELDQMTLSAAQLLERQRAALDESNRALFDQIQAEKARTAALEEQTQRAKEIATGLLSDVDSAFQALQQAVGKQKAAQTDQHTVQMKALQQRIDAENVAINKLKSLSSLLTGSLDSMRLQGTDGSERLSAQAQIKAALAIAKAGGVLPDADSLRRALGVVTQDAASMFSSYEEYVRDFYSTQNDIADLSKLTDSALSVEQQTLDALLKQKDEAQLAYEAEMKRLDSIVDAAGSQIAELKGQSTTLLNIEQALAALANAILAAQSNAMASGPASITSAYQGSLGRAPDSAGMAFWQSQMDKGTPVSDIVAAIKNSPEAKAQSLYQSVLGRVGDAAGISFWTQQLASGVSVNAVRAAMMRSDEYRKRPLPGFMVGTNELPEDMDIRAHRGERIVPPADNRELIRRLAQPVPTRDDSSLQTEIGLLRTTVEGLQGALKKIATSTERHADMFEKATGNGGPLLVEMA